MGRTPHPVTHRLCHGKTLFRKGAFSVGHPVAHSNWKLGICSEHSFFLLPRLYAVCDITWPNCALATSGGSGCFLPSAPCCTYVLECYAISSMVAATGRGWTRMLSSSSSSCASCVFGGSMWAKGAICLLLIAKLPFHPLPYPWWARVVPLPCSTWETPPENPPVKLYSGSILLVAASWQKRLPMLLTIILFLLLTWMHSNISFKLVETGIIKSSSPLHCCLAGSHVWNHSIPSCWPFLLSAIHERHCVECF